MKKLKKLNNISLIFILVLIIIYLLFDEHLIGIWNVLFLIVLAVSVIGSIAIELLIRNRKKSK